MKQLIFRSVATLQIESFCNFLGHNVTNKKNDYIFFFIGEFKRYLEHRCAILIRQFTKITKQIHQS